MTTNNIVLLIKKKIAIPVQMIQMTAGHLVLAAAPSWLFRFLTTFHWGGSDQLHTDKKIDFTEQAKKTFSNWHRMYFQLITLL